MAKEATNPKPSMQTEWYCLAVHKNTCERIFEYVWAEKQTAEKSFCQTAEKSDFDPLIFFCWLA